MQPEIGAVEQPFQYTTGSTISAFETTNVRLTKVPVESVTSLIEHLTNLVNTKQVTKPVYDPKVKKSANSNFRHKMTHWTF